MKEFYKEYFYVPKDGKVRDKVMVARAVVTVIAIVACLVALGLTPYAYYSYNVYTNSNVIKAANFEAVVTVKDSNGHTVDPTVKKDNTETHELAAGTYTFEIKGSDSSSAKTGFCILNVGGDKYHTQQIDKNKQISFTLEVQTPIELKVIYHWGTSSYYGYDDAASNPSYIANNETVKLPKKLTSSKPGTPSVETTPTPTPTPTPTAPPPITTEIAHEVVKGDKLNEIAEKYGTTVERIVAYNGLKDKDIIKIGETLLIPPDDWEMPEATPSPTPEVTPSPTPEITPAPTEEPSDETTAEPEVTVEPTSEAEDVQQ